MSVINPNETSKVWQAHRPERVVQLYLSGAEGDAGAIVGAQVAGYPIQLNIVPITDWIDVQELASAAAAVVQVDPDSPASLKRFQKLAETAPVPLIAAAYEPPLALVRSLLRSGAHDVLPLPLDIEDLEASLAPVRDELTSQPAQAPVRTAKLITVIKSSGGVGATALLSQLAVRFAGHEAAFKREACLVDLDVQFGDIAFQLGLKPKLSLVDVFDAGARLDPSILRTIAAEHPSGLKVIAAPPEMLPLESLTSEQVFEFIEMAERAFGTVFVDLPANWTNWSLSLLARSDLVLLVTELSVAGLHRARRQLDLIRSQELSVDVRVVANRHEKALFRTLKPNDVHNALGCDIAYTIANDEPVMRAALDRGVPIEAIKRKSAVGRDIDMLDAGIAAALGLER